MGMFSSIHEATRSIHLPEQYFPKIEEHEIYMKHFDVFESLSFKLAPEFEKIVDLQ
jgi:gluconokinase